MITGIVQRREAVIPLTVLGSRRQRMEFDAVIDTGYTGWITLPPGIVSALGLRWYSLGRGILADGTISIYDVYVARIVWDGNIRKVRVNQLDAAPLIGMSLLRGFALNMRVRYRGPVTLTKLS